MLRFFGVFFLLFLFGCNIKTEEQNAVSRNSNVDAEEDKPIIKIERLTNKEIKFLNRLVAENPFVIIQDSMERYYGRKRDTVAVFNRLILPEDSLLKKGYVYYDLEFYGDIDDVNITYKFSMGQTAQGFGSVSGDDIEDYLHTYKSCGVTSCFTSVYRNGQKIFDKETKN
jgi:hypothetical protein